MTDEKIIELYYCRDEQAIHMSVAQYGAYCRSVAARILPNAEDVEEAVADTWISAWNTMPPQRPKCLRLYLGKIARNHALSLWRKNNAYRRGGGETALALEELGQVAGGDTPEQVVDIRELGKAIEAFLQTEPPRRRGVFLRRYFYMEDAETIAARYGIRESNLRMMLSRTRQKLKKYLEQEGYIQ